MKNRIQKYPASYFLHSASCALLITFCLLLLGAVLSPPVDAAIPETMTYQGRLTDEFGAPVADGSYSISFYLYDQLSGGSLIWSQDHDGGVFPEVTVNNGIFSVELDMSLVPDWTDQYFFTLAVEGDPEMSPRIPINSVPYSFNASRLNGQLGPNSEIVGIDDVQTLTNKTLDTPAIDLPIINSGANLTATSTDLEMLKDYSLDSNRKVLTYDTATQLIGYEDGGWSWTDYMRDGAGDIDEAADFGLAAPTWVDNLDADLLDGLNASEISFGTISGLTEEGTINNLEVVYLTNTGTIDQADATPSSTPTYRAIGFRIDVGKVQPGGTLDGMTDEDSNPLTPGTTYYVSKTTPGAITATAPTDGAWIVKVGRALDADTLIIDIADGVTYDSGWQYVDTSSDDSVVFSHYLNSQSMTAYWMFAENSGGSQHVFTRMAQDTGEPTIPGGRPKGGSSLELSSVDTCTLFLGEFIIQAIELDPLPPNDPIVYQKTQGYVKAIAIRDLGGAGGGGAGAPAENHWGKTGDDIQNTNIGNVGIGALPGAYKLDVDGYTNTVDGFCIDGDCITGWGALGGGDITKVGDVDQDDAFSGSAGNTLYFEGTGGGAGDILLQGGAAPGSNVTVTIPPTTGTIMLRNLTSSHIFVGDGTNTAVDVAMSGDVHIDNAGLTTIQPDSVDLGGDTVGNYVNDVAGENAITVSGAPDEGYTETVKLGGSLTEATTITQGNFDMLYDLSGTGDFKVQSPAGNALVVKDDGSLSVGNEGVADYETLAHFKRSYDGTNAARGVLAHRYQTGASNANIMSGVYGTSGIWNMDGFTASWMVGVEAGTEAGNNTGSLTNAASFYAHNPAGNPAPTNAYGIYLENITSGSNNYSIYSAGGTNYLAGNVGIGTIPGSELDVEGTLRLSGATSGYVGLAPQAAAGSTTYTLPAAADDGKYLMTDGSGNLSWDTPTGTGGTMDDFTLSDGTSTQLIEDGDTLQVLGGTAINALVAATDQVTISVGNNAIDGTQLADDITLDADLAFETDTLFIGQDGGSYEGRIGIGTATPGKLLEMSNAVGTANLGLTGSGGNVEHNMTDEYDIIYARTVGWPTMDFRGIASDGTGTAEFRFGIDSGSTGANRIVLFEPSSSTRQTQLSTSNENSYFNAQGGNVGIGTTTPGQLLTVDGTLGILDGSSTYHTIIQGGTQTADITYTLPTEVAVGEYLTTDGSGVLSWGTPAGLGDMLKSTYDTEPDNIVDASENLIFGSDADGDVAYRTSGAYARLPIGSPDQVLKVNGSNLPYWGTDDIGTAQNIFDEFQDDDSDSVLATTASDSLQITSGNAITTDLTDTTGPDYVLTIGVGNNAIDGTQLANDITLDADLAFETDTLFIGQDGGSYAGMVGIGTSVPEGNIHISVPLTGGADEANLIVNTEGTSAGDASYLKLLEQAGTLTDYGAMLKYEASPNLFAIGTLDNNVEYPAIYIPRASTNVGIGTTNPGQLLTVDGTLGILDGSSTFHTILQGGTQTADITYTLPTGVGAGQYLTTDGSGVLSWGTPAGLGDMLKTTYDTEPNNIVDAAENLIFSSDADGDIAFRTSGAYSRLPIGSEDQVLKVSAGSLPYWGTDDTGTAQNI
ncbi:beta strand repeat-containing protein, partial [Candidatus Omnitrophota bacterium]